MHNTFTCLVSGMMGTGKKYLVKKLLENYGDTIISIPDRKAWVYTQGHALLMKWGGHGGRVVTLSPPTSEAGVRFPAQPQVGKLVVSCRWSAVYSTEP